MGDVQKKELKEIKQKMEDMSGDIEDNKYQLRTHSKLINIIDPEVVKKDTCIHLKNNDTPFNESCKTMFYEDGKDKYDMATEDGQNKFKTDFKKWLGGGKKRRSKRSRKGRRKSRKKRKRRKSRRKRKRTRTRRRKRRR